MSCPHLDSLWLCIQFHSYSDIIYKVIGCIMHHYDTPSTLSHIALHSKTNEAEAQSIVIILCCAHKLALEERRIFY